tara:strand:+ start:346 stop:537 length:192 start_codon:yes stop_codon:yes gene_type:complete
MPYVTDVCADAEEHQQSNTLAITMSVFFCIYLAFDTLMAAVVVASKARETARVVPAATFVLKP